MKIMPEKILGVGLSVGLMIGASACGDEKPSAESIDTEIQRISGELELAKVALSAGQTEYWVEVESLPDDCEQAVRAYIPPGGALRNADLSEATKVTAEWCGPDNLDAVAVIRGMFDGLNSLQSQVDGLEFSLGANLAAAGDTIPEVKE